MGHQLQSNSITTRVSLCHTDRIINKSKLFAQTLNEMQSKYEIQTVCLSEAPLFQCKKFKSEPEREIENKNNKKTISTAETTKPNQTIVIRAQTNVEQYLLNRI